MRVQTTPVPTPAAKPAKGVVAAPAKPATPAVATKDALALASAKAPEGITVDANGQLAGDGGLAVTGTVSLDRTFMERLVRHVTRKPAFGERDVRFDAASQTYKGSVELKVKGFKLKLIGACVPLAMDNHPAFQFKDLAVKIGPITLRGAWVRNLAAKLIAKEITNGGINAYAAKPGVIKLDPTTLLYDAEVLPHSTYLDQKRTTFGVKMAPNGDVAIQLKSALPVPTANRSPKSDLAGSLDGEALLKMLAPVLGQDYQLEKVTFKPGTILLDGKVEAKPLSDAVNIGKGLLAVFLAAAGRPPTDMSAETVLVGLQLEAKVQGTQVLLTPSLALALPELEETLEKAGFTPTREGKALKFDVGPMLAPYGVRNIKVSEGKLSAESELDINALIKAPILRGEKW